MSVKVTITYNKEDRILEAVPKSVTVRLNESLEFISEDGLDFAVVFKNDSPFNSPVFYKKLNSGLPVVGADKDIAYKYTVHARGLTLDPEVIIEDPQP